MKLLLSVFLYLIVKVSGDDDSGWSIVGNPLVAAHPCNGSTDIQLMYEPGRSPKEENKYNLRIHKKFPKYSIILLKFDKGATVTLSNETFARIDLDKSADHAFRIRFFESHDGIGFHIQGCALGIVPYLQSVNINTKEYCQEPFMGVLDSYIEGYKIQATSSCTQQHGQQKYDELSKQKPLSEQKYECGRRQIPSNVLSENGESQHGDWPWHTAVYLREESKLRYLCGGTLITSFHVLTAAHCVSRRETTRPPDTLIVTLGRTGLQKWSEFTDTSKSVEKVTVHENFLYINLDNDIALLKLKSEIIFTKFIQPACIWYKNAHLKLPSGPIMGTIVGWGFNENDEVPNNLNQARLPMIPDNTCILSKPDFFLKVLNGMKFCAGKPEEAVACNGDSGGGFHVFIPDNIRDNSTTGVWHIRGIISMGVPGEGGLCSSSHYTVFTDVDKYREWISSNIQNVDV